MALLQLFLQFVQAFDASKVHKMLALMLDPHQGLETCDRLWGHGDTIEVVVDYDSKSLIRMLIICLYKLNPPPCASLDIDSMLDNGAEETNFSGHGRPLTNQPLLLLGGSYLSLGD